MNRLPHQVTIEQHILEGGDLYQWRIGDGPSSRHHDDPQECLVESVTAIRAVDGWSNRDSYGQPEPFWVGERFWPATMLGCHVHPCPDCYEAIPCDHLCRIVEDLQRDDGTPSGAYHSCDQCSGRGEK